jgi:hypothetical protein
VARLSRFSVACALLALSTPAGAASQRAEQTSTDPASVARVRAKLETPPSLNLDWAAILPLVTFKTSVEQRVYVLSFKEQLAKEFTLTPMQQQSQEWASRCCGVNLVQLVSGLEKRLERRRERKTREAVARELAAIQAAAGK